MISVMRSCLVLVILFAAAVARAETPRMIFQSGQWAVYLVENVPAPDRTLAMPRACSAETRIKNGALSLAMDGQFLINSITSPNWNFQKKISIVTLAPANGEGKLTLGDAQYYGNTIRHFSPILIPMVQFMIGDFGEGAESGGIRVVDEKNRVIATFPGKGFLAAAKRALDCATKL